MSYEDLYLLDNPVREITENDLQIAKVNNFKILCNGNLAKIGKYSNSDNFKLVVDEGWMFNTTQWGVGFYSQGIAYNCELNEEMTEAIVPNVYFPSLDKWDGLETHQDKADSVGGLNNIYKLNRDEVLSLTREVMYEKTALFEQYNIQYESFLINYFALPFKIPDEIILDKENIQIATLTMDSKGNRVDTDIIKIDLGEIAIPANEKNILDYSNTIARLHLPYSDPIALELNSIIGEKIYIKLEINAYTGSSNYLIYSSKSGVDVFSHSVDLGLSIPLVKMNQLNPTTLFTSPPQLLKDTGIRSPFIELISSNSELNSGLFNAPILDDGKLKNHSGYIVVNNINLECKTTRNEIDMIRSVLSGGVLL